MIRDEGDVAGEAIQLRDHQGSAMLAAELEGGSEGRPVIALAAFNFQDLLNKRPVPAIEESVDSGALRFKSEAAGSLPCGRDSQVAYKLAVFHGSSPLLHLINVRRKNVTGVGNAQETAAVTLVSGSETKVYDEFSCPEDLRLALRAE